MRFPDLMPLSQRNVQFFIMPGAAYGQRTLSRDDATGYIIKIHKKNLLGVGG